MWPGSPWSVGSDQEAIWSPDPPEVLGLEAAAPRLVEASGLGVPLIVRLGCSAGVGPTECSEELVRLIRELAPHAQFFSLTSLAVALADGWSLEQWTIHLRTVLEAAQAAARPVLLCVPCDVDAAKAEVFLDAALGVGIAGSLSMAAYVPKAAVG